MLAGIVVLVVERDGEAVFVNIVGEIDPEDVGRLGHNWEIHGLEDFDFDL
mgnify:CR=1 FL=1